MFAIIHEGEVVSVETEQAQIKDLSLFECGQAGEISTNGTGFIAVERGNCFMLVSKSKPGQYHDHAYLTFFASEELARSQFSELLQLEHNGEKECLVCESNHADDCYAQYWKHLCEDGMVDIDDCYTMLSCRFWKV